MPGIVQNRPDDTVITRQPRGIALVRHPGAFDRLVAVALVRSRTGRQTNAIPVLNLVCPRGRRFA
jgi:hypothetical protein